jgi:hypothetical protein
MRNLEILKKIWTDKFDELSDKEHFFEIVDKIFEEYQKEKLTNNLYDIFSNMSKQGIELAFMEDPCLVNNQGIILLPTVVLKN